MTPAPATSRRVVLHHTAGPYPGLCQILGTWTGGDTPLDYYPAVEFWPDRRQGPARLLRVTDRGVYYVEVPMLALATLPVAI